ncbi:MAG TPA: hypothetical protein DCW31_00020 [Lactobacillus sp.]|nr:hypothetical protein [Lactobacillus sp.]
MENENFMIVEILRSVKQFGSITGAAKHLFVSQPYVSRIIKQTEKQLSVTLIDRSTRPTKLSYAGEVYLNGLNKITNDATMLNDKLYKIVHSEIGNLSIGLSESMEEHVFPLVITNFLRQFPQYHLEIHELPSNQAQQAVIDNQIDIYVGPKTILKGRFLYRKMFQQSLMLVVPKNITSVPTNIIAIKDLTWLEKTPFIEIGHTMALGEIIEQFFEDNAIRPIKIVTINNLNSIVQLCSLGLGSSILPADEKIIDALSESCKCIPISKNILAFDIIMGHRTSKSNTPEMNAFLKVVQKILKIDPRNQTVYQNE